MILSIFLEVCDVKDDNPVLLSVKYIKPPKRGSDSGLKESFEVIYKTSDGNVHKTYEPPLADIYIMKPEFRRGIDYTLPEARLDQLVKESVPISKIRYRLIDEAGQYGENILNKAYSERKFGILNNIFKWPYAFGCDFQPEYYFMKRWYSKYELKVPALTKAFIDIEIDNIDYTPDLDNLYSTAYSPVNVVTVILDEGTTPDAYTFVLRPYEPSKLGRSELEYKRRHYLYSQQLKAHEAMMNYPDDFISGLHKEFDPTYGNINYRIRSYDNEIELIADVFRLINHRKPNFCLAWNMRFDIQYLYYRIKALGYDPASIMCHPDFENKNCYFKVDNRELDFAKQFDYFYCSSYTQYVCQMRLYSSIRKSQHKLKSVKLNAIAEKELKDRKVEYADEDNMVMFSYHNWRRFIVYNIKDVLLQLGIERRVNDITTYYNRSHANLTPYDKIFKETHLLRNVREKYFEEDGWVQSNNLNVLDSQNSEAEKAFYGLEDDSNNKVSFKGAINADPKLNAKIGKVVLGRRTNNLFDNAVDFDMGAFYPSIKIASNMDPITLLYKASLINDEFKSGEFPNKSLNTTYEEKDKNNKIRKVDITGEAINTYVSGNILTFGYNYNSLPSITELTDKVLMELGK